MHTRENGLGVFLGLHKTRETESRRGSKSVLRRAGASPSQYSRVPHSMVTSFGKGSTPERCTSAYRLPSLLIEKKTKIEFYTWVHRVRSSQQTDTTALTQNVKGEGNGRLGGVAQYMT